MVQRAWWGWATRTIRKLNRRLAAIFRIEASDSIVARCRTTLGGRTPRVAKDPCLIARDRSNRSARPAVVPKSVVSTTKQIKKSNKCWTRANRKWTTLTKTYMVQARTCLQCRTPWSSTNNNRMPSLTCNIWCSSSFNRWRSRIMGRECSSRCRRTKCSCTSNSSSNTRVRRQCPSSLNNSATLL